MEDEPVQSDQSDQSDEAFESLPDSPQEVVGYSHVGENRHRHLDPVGSNHINHDHEGGDSAHTHPGAFPDGPPAERQPQPAIAAFLVFQYPDGTWVATPDINVPLQVERQAGPYDYKAGCSCVLIDVQAMEASQRMVQLQQQSAMAMMEQMQAAKLAQAAGMDGSRQVISEKHLRR